MEKLMNAENEWSDSIDVSKVEGAVRRIDVEKVQCAMNQMKIGKASGPSGVAIKMFKAGGDKCLKFLTNIINDILYKDKLLEEWMLSVLVPIFKGKGDPLNPNSYRGIKLFEHAFKRYKILDGCFCEVVDIDKMQHGFIPRRGTVDAVFVLRRLTEKFIAKKKNLFFVFVGLEKAFDWVSREVICFALRQKVVPEYLVNGVMSLYNKGCKTAVSVDGELSSSFSVKVSVHQGFVLSLLLFIMVMYVLTEDLRDGSLMELLYADDLVLCGKSLNEVMDKYGRLKNAAEGKGLKVNVDKTKAMQLLFGKKSSVSKEDP